jgi:hypothetical protein
VLRTAIPLTGPLSRLCSETNIAIRGTAVVAVVGLTAAGVHYDGGWGGVAAFSAVLLVFSMIHALTMIGTTLLSILLLFADHLVQRSSK